MIKHLSDRAIFAARHVAELLIVKVDCNRIRIILVVRFAKQ